MKYLAWTAVKTYCDQEAFILNSLLYSMKFIKNLTFRINDLAQIYPISFPGTNQNLKRNILKFFVLQTELFLLSSHVIFVIIAHFGFVLDRWLLIQWYPVGKFQ